MTNQFIKKIIPGTTRIPTIEIINASNSLFFVKKIIRIGQIIVVTYVASSFVLYAFLKLSSFVK